ncbi:nitrate- and nitrite sensing domain-containing protein [Zoogloea sp.]|uniref:nitrate- and nitrite sensing domain-containing protein n=1 Tax=Zoogloea sp. TaxID=49181 RepID=UPI0026213E11|nr:nitrate- and nitrite sensing domain-containing protein [Zoogloea sp.]MDD3355043.1 nitrate- and nitrite sensing domain-containing protein [Zoogloea sp.]
MGGAAQPATPAARDFSAACLFAGELLALLRVVQRHRGLCAGPGGVPEPGPARAAAVNVGRALARCQKTSASLPPCRQEQAFLATLAADWRALRDHWPRLLPEQVFLRHTRLIGELLRQVEKLAQHWPGVDQRGHSLTTYACHLPALAEALGQIRALGCAIAAEGGCPLLKRTRLLYLCSEVQAHLGAALQGQGEGAPPIEARVARTAAEGLVHRVRAEFLQDRVAYPVAEFYRGATEAIDAVFTWIELMAAVWMEGVPE